ncbi:MAG: hypothetical protein V7746_03630 [Halioglobus sp.]
MAIASIRETIQHAILQESASGELRAKIRQQISWLDKKLILPDDEPESALMAFITSYVECVPGSLTLVAALSKKFGFHGYAAPFLHLAEDYFLQPPEVIAQEQGLAGLLDEAFLAHRLLEEVNDHHVRQLQGPLLPVDMTEANIIVHHLIGDDLASQLEHLVQFTAAQLLSKEHNWAKLKAMQGKHTAVKRFIALDDLSRPERQVRLRLAS